MTIVIQPSYNPASTKTSEANPFGEKSSAEKPEFSTLEEYLTAESTSVRKHEYIDGWVRAMTGATNRHNLVVCNATFALFAALRNQPCKPYNSDTKVRIKTQQGFCFDYPDAPDRNFISSANHRRHGSGSSKENAGTHTTASTM